MLTELKMTFSDDFLELFHNHKYEEYVLEIMNTSAVIFKGSYMRMSDQSRGQCDFIDIETMEKYDAKIPFENKSMKLLATNDNQEEIFQEWVRRVLEMENEYDPIAIKNGTLCIEQTKLYSVMKRLICKDKADENIIFFIPVQFVPVIKESVFAQFVPDFLRDIYECLESDGILDGRQIYAIYPSGERDDFVLRDLSSYTTEYVKCQRLGRYFNYEYVGGG